jgi:L-fucose isomerase-like protein
MTQNETVPDPRSDRGQATGEPNGRGAALRVGLVAIGRKRPGFDADWGKQMEAAASRATAEMRLDTFRPPTRVVDDVSLRRALDEVRHAACDALVVLQPTMGDGRLAPTLAQLWNAPPVFWATPERQDSVRVSSCSLVGTHVFASIFRQWGRPFEIVCGHPGDGNTRQQLMTAVHLAAAGARLRRAKVGLVGSHAPGFVNMHVDPAALSGELGVSLHQFGLQEFFDLVESQEANEVADDVARVEATGLSREDGLSRDDFVVNSRYYLAMRALLDEEGLDALAVRCWPELPGRFGAWPYLAMARLADEGRVVALEGDVDGAVACLMGRLLGAGVGYLSDWLEHDEHTVTLWHPGHAPLAMCAEGTARLGRHFNNRLPLVVSATLAADRPITLFRLWRCDGTYRMMACDARTKPPRRELLGAHGLAVIEDRNVPEWFETLCHEGMPHHLTVFSGRHGDILKRFARQLRIRWLDAP